MILRSLPDLPTCTTEFRQWFHARWGSENCIVLGRSTRAEFGPSTHTLSIRAAWGGMQHCHVGSRTIGVDDDNFLILNHGRVYSTSIYSTLPVEFLVICFRTGLVEQTLAAMGQNLQQALDQDVLECSMPEFMENLRPHDKLVSPVLRFIRRHARLGIEDEAWYEEQLIFLLERMQRHRSQLLSRADTLKHAQRTRRRELLRRIAVATDFLNTNYADDLDLDRVSSVACISKYHFLRLFTCIQGITPMAYLQRKRALVAMRLLQRTSLTAREVAATVGFENGTLLRQIRQWTGLTVQQIRARRSDDLRAATREAAGLDVQPC